MTRFAQIVLALLLLGQRCDEAPTPPEGKTAWCHGLDDPTAVIAGGTIVYTGYAVEFGASEGPTVQRGQIAAQGATASENVTITPLADLDYAMVHGTGQGNRQNGAFPGSGSSDHGDAFVAWDFVDTSTIRAQHFVGGAEANNDLPWEVIDWRPAAAPGGRVLWR